MVFRWYRYLASIAANALFRALRYLSLSIVSPVFLATLARWSRLRINFQTGAFNQAGRLLRMDVNLDGMHSSMAAEIACVKWFGVRTLRTKDTSDPRHFCTMCLVPKCPMDTSAPVPKCLGHFGTKVHETLRTQN